MSEPKVYIVDDDRRARDSLSRLVTSIGLESCLYPGAEEFLKDFNMGMRGCLVVDFRMAGMSGLNLHKKLQESGSRLPVILVTAFADVPLAVEALKSGAVDVIQKPYRANQLLESINQALLADRQRDYASSDHDRWGITAGAERLTPREREVMRHLVQGRSNKLIAQALEISPRTVEIHRRRVLQKTGVSSVAELVRNASEQNLGPPVS